MDAYGWSLWRVSRLPPPLWLSPSLCELLDLLGRERPRRVVKLIARLVEDIFVIHCLPFAVNSLVAADSLAVVEFIVEAVKLVVFVPPAVEKVCVAACPGEAVAGHFEFLSVVSSFSLCELLDLFSCIYDENRVVVALAWGMRDSRISCMNSYSP